MFGSQVRFFFRLSVLVFALVSANIFVLLQCKHIVRQFSVVICCVGGNFQFLFIVLRACLSSCFQIRSFVWFVCSAVFRCVHDNFLFTLLVFFCCPEVLRTLLGVVDVFPVTCLSCNVFVLVVAHSPFCFGCCPGIPKLNYFLWIFCFLVRFAQLFVCLCMSSRQPRILAFGAHLFSQASFCLFLFNLRWCCCCSSSRSRSAQFDCLAMFSYFLCFPCCLVVDHSFEKDFHCLFLYVWFFGAAVCVILWLLLCVIIFAGAMSLPFRFCSWVVLSLGVLAVVLFCMFFVCNVIIYKCLSHIFIVWSPSLVAVRFILVVIIWLPYISCCFLVLLSVAVNT